MTEIVLHAPIGLEALASAARDALLTALERLGAAASSEVALVLTDDEEIRRMNRDFRGIDEATDVLSFAPRRQPSPAFDPAFLGDIVISVPFAERDARDAGHETVAEVRLLAVHGLLHLLGHDDSTPTGADAMYRLEVELGFREAQ